MRKIVFASFTLALLSSASFALAQATGGAGAGAGAGASSGVAGPCVPGPGVTCPPAGGAGASGGAGGGATVTAPGGTGGTVTGQGGAGAGAGATTTPGTGTAQGGATGGATGGAGATGTAQGGATAGAGATGGTNVTVNLSTQQRTELRTVIEAEKPAPVANVTFTVNIGVVVPPTITLRACPARVIELVGELKVIGCQYFVLADGRIIVVRPDTRLVVLVITA